ncbi:uncharacterized protein ACA1_395380 [Acanthamoeba castellanii str. Neff]|uniref:PAS domain-containing protein n=1 Tax=Acanthamoeba castellanii (strain ATCC 30010 / Neff) TaxID=1257118 RepID=L8H2U3_ACACF|nr:uncharacterized protein ACA1_395380 [Acanthamoeba castellanii str. Neff]ELR18711.1 hypothetical protein ACA1_395380 [Acanthamoeba castellanii str. Neff]
MKEAETLDDMDTPVIVYMSPSMCELLGYDMLELHGSRLTSICSPRPEYLAAFVRVILMRPPTRVGQPLFLSRGPLITKQGRNVPLSTAHQFLYSQRRLAQYQIMQVNSVLGTDLGPTPHMRPIPSIVHDPIVRAHLLARLPHSLLFGCQGEMTSTQPAIEDLTVEEAAALMAAMTQHHQHQRPPGRQDVMTRAQGSEEVDDELDEIMRVLGLPIESGGVRASPFSRLVMGFNSSRTPPTTPATLAERWMR